MDTDERGEGESERDAREQIRGKIWANIDNMGNDMTMKMTQSSDGARDCF